MFTINGAPEASMVLTGAGSQEGPSALRKPSRSGLRSGLAIGRKE